MHTKRFSRDCLWGVVVALALTLAPGCELLVDFDRSLIPNDASPAEPNSLVPIETRCDRQRWRPAFNSTPAGNRPQLCGSSTSLPILTAPDRTKNSRPRAFATWCMFR